MRDNILEFVLLQRTLLAQVLLLQTMLSLINKNLTLWQLSHCELSTATRQLFKLHLGLSIK